jgi:hypothetical protein
MKNLKQGSVILLLAFSMSPLAGQTVNRNTDIVFIGNIITQGVQLTDPSEEGPKGAPLSPEQYHI